MTGTFEYTLKYSHIFYILCIFGISNAQQLNENHENSCRPPTVVEWMKNEFHTGKRDKRQSSLIECPNGWNVFASNCYMVVKNQFDQPNAEMGCRNSGGHLTAIRSADENEFLRSLSSNLGISSVWVGLRYEDNTRWKWLNLIPYNYSNWNDGQPSDPSSSRCVILNIPAGGRWETSQCYPKTADGYACMTNPGLADACKSNPCENGGYCNRGQNGQDFRCTCRGGFSGSTCSVISSACVNRPCQNGGTCVDGGTYYQCNCVGGFHGTTCEQNGPTSVESGGQNGTCSLGACANGGTCIAQSTTGFKCTCPAGYTGQRCETNTDDCVANPCANGATCMDGVNEFICKCSSGWSGPTCSQRISNCDPNPCKHGGRCFILSTSEYICKCTDGYLGEQCEKDVNECDYGICPSGSNCVNTPGSYKCMCQSGGDTVACTNSVGNADSSGNPCYSNPCKNGATCTALSSGFSCTCPSGYTGSACETLSQNPCIPNPCVNGGTCASSVNAQSTCTCPSGYTGPKCEYGSASNSPTNCLQNPCQNGAKCAAGQNGAYICQCEKAYTGRTCADTWLYVAFTGRSYKDPQSGVRDHIQKVANDPSHVYSVENFKKLTAHTVRRVRDYAVMKQECQLHEVCRFKKGECVHDWWRMNNIRNRECKNQEPNIDHKLNCQDDEKQCKETCDRIWKWESRTCEKNHPGGAKIIRRQGQLQPFQMSTFEECPSNETINCPRQGNPDPANPNKGKNDGSNEEGTGKDSALPWWGILIIVLIIVIVIASMLVGFVVWKKSKQQKQEPSTAAQKQKQKRKETTSIIQGEQKSGSASLVDENVGVSMQYLKTGRSQKATVAKSKTRNRRQLVKRRKSPDRGCPGDRCFRKGKNPSVKWMRNRPRKRNPFVHRMRNR